MLYPRDPEYIRLKVDAVNRCNDLANQLYKQMVAAFTPLLGKPVILNDLSLSKRVAAKIPEPIGKGQKGVHVYYYANKWNVAWHIRVTVWDASENNHVDAECHVYAGTLKEGVLEAITPAEQQLRKTDYDYDTIMELRKRAAELRKQFDDAQSACHPFEDDSLRR